jgi:hypothetical protein
MVVWLKVCNRWHFESVLRPLDGFIARAGFSEANWELSFIMLSSKMHLIEDALQFEGGGRYRT